MSETAEKKAKAKRNPKPKSLNKMLAELEKAKEQIARASSDGESTIDLNKFDSLVSKARRDIAQGMGLPVGMVKVNADVVIDVKAAE